MSFSGNISDTSVPYYMSHSLFVIHVACASTILVTGVVVNAVSIGVIIRLKLFREISVLFTLHLMTVNFVASIVSMSIALVNSFHPTGKADMFCRITGYIIFVLIGVQMCNITLISVSAYVKVAHSSVGKAFFSKTCNIAMCLVFIWVLPLLKLSLPLTELWGEFIITPQSPWCLPIRGGYGVFLVCFALVVTISALLFSYVGIVRTVLQSRRKVGATNQLTQQNRQKLRKEQYFVAAVIIMVTSFIILYFPSGLLPVIDSDLSLGVDIHVSFTYVTWSQNIVETMIYSLLHSKIRSGIKTCFFGRKANRDC